MGKRTITVRYKVRVARRVRVVQTTRVSSRTVAVVRSFVDLALRQGGTVTDESTRDRIFDDAQAQLPGTSDDEIGEAFDIVSSEHER